MRQYLTMFGVPGMTRRGRTNRGGPSGSPMLITVHSCLEKAEPIVKFGISE